jgi:carbon-monoxide dehydrogenase large subunit
MSKFGISQSIQRTEDRRFLTGKGRYTDDINLPGQAYGYVLRSPHAHARIEAVKIEAARSGPGVLGVYTSASLKAEDIGHLPCLVGTKNRDGSKRADTPRPALAEGTVRHVGDPVAFIVADTLLQARDAAERIEIDYDVLPAVADLRHASDRDAPQIWEGAAGNRLFDWETGDKAKVDELFAKARHVTTLELVNNRVVVASMETRAALAAYDAQSRRFTLYTGSQGVELLQRVLANVIFKLPKDRFRLITPDVGGAFGMKIFLYPEPVLCLYAARKLNRPVKWTAERSEAFLSDTQGRAHWTQAELALDGEGNFLAIKVHDRADMGAYFSMFAPFVPTVSANKVLPSVYRLQAVYSRVEGLCTNTVPVDAYRGAGRPETNYLVERLIDKAARELKRDPAELRQQNFVPPAAMPWQNALNYTYDSGDFAALTREALTRARWAEFPKRRASAKTRAKRRGIGLAYYLEATAGDPSERAEIRFPGDGVELLVGTQSAGQGHETAYAQILAAQLDLPVERIRILQGDTDAIPFGGGTGGSRSLYSQGPAIILAADEAIKRGLKAAGEALEAASADIEFRGGQFRVKGTDRAIGLLDLAADARRRGQPLDSSMEAKIPAHTFPNGCHIAEVEIDEATGAVEVVGYWVVDDMGNMINPMIAAGQIQGGVAQGLGQALLEHTVYDAKGQLVSGSFMDYCLPRADQVPSLDIAFHPVPCTTNPLGVKGAGEAGAIGAPAAIINAVVDALADLGVLHVDMPATSERIWRLLKQHQK